MNSLFYLPESHCPRAAENNDNVAVVNMTTWMRYHKKPAV